MIQYYLINSKNGSINAKSVIRKLDELKFITRATRAIILKGTIYNPNTDLFYIFEKVY